MRRFRVFIRLYAYIYSVSVTRNSYLQCSGDVFRLQMLSQALTNNVDTKTLKAIKLEISPFTLNALQVCTNV